MANDAKIYDAFGELIYSVAISDGIIQKEELTVLDEMLEGHPYEKEIKWSFKYEMNKGSSLKDTYNKAISAFKDHGPNQDYGLLVEILEKLAEASDGIDRTEGRVISNFQKTLRAHFIQYLDENGLLRRR